MIPCHVLNMKIVVLNFIVICPKIIHICPNVKFYVLLMNSVVKPMSADRVFIVAMLMLGWDPYSIFFKIMLQLMISSMRIMVL